MSRLIYLGLKLVFFEILCNFKFSLNDCLIYECVFLSIANELIDTNSVVFIKYLFRIFLNHIVIQEGRVRREKIIKIEIIGTNSLTNEIRYTFSGRR